MENKFYKVFYGALVIGVFSMVLLTIILLFGEVFDSCAGIIIFISCLAFSAVVAIIAICLMNKDYEKEAKNKTEKQAKKNNTGKYDEQLKLLTDKVMLRHQERMALIRQMGKDAPNKEILELLKSERETCDKSEWEMFEKIFADREKIEKIEETKEEEETQDKSKEGKGK